MSELELVLRHDGNDWIASAPGLDVRGADFAILDERLRRRLIGEYEAPGTTVRVHMRFDVDGLPGWMRQYAAHYFNRRVRLTL